MLLESSLPVRTEDEDGELHKVDVSLEATSSGYETENALVEVQIPESVDEPIEVGEEGVAIKLAGADGDQPARPFGDENVFAHEVLPDTDMLVSPIATGVEIFNILRSEDSPETLRFQVELPSGAELRADGEWGAEVVKDGETLTTIREPVAIDAQGTNVPVELELEGNSLLLTVDHREGDYAMPILLDPILEDNANWMYGQNHDALGLWGYWNAGSWWFQGSTQCIYECFGPGGTGTRGLYVSLEGQRSYGAGQFGQWAYGAPTNSYISYVTLGAPYVHADHNCPESQYPQPHNYFGLWSNGWNAWTAFSTNSANQPGGSWTLPNRGDTVVFGLSTGGGISWMPCWRDLYAGGAHIYLDDDNWPSVQAVQDPPTGWINSTTPVHVVAQASDAGLGIQNVVMHTSDGGVVVLDIPEPNQCSGTRRNPCLTGHTAEFNMTGASFREGRRVGFITAYDPTGKYANSHYFETKVDGRAPETWLDGRLAEETNEVGSAEHPAGEGDELTLPVYNLQIKAEDGKLGSPEIEWQSGVKEIEIYLDDVPQEVPWSPTPSCAHDCPMTQTYALKLSKIETAGKHKLRVIVRDFAGNFRERNIEFEYFPATGMKDEYVMQYFPLPDGSGNEAEEEHPERPELAVNVMNGNLVYRETDIDVEGTAALDLEVERYYNSQLPSGENTEWGDGWTLAQTPQLEPIKSGGSPVPNEAEIVDTTGVIEGDITLPTETGGSKFDADLQATLTKTAGGGYELSDETGESPGSIAFDATGQAEALLSDSYAKVDYDYEGGELSEIEVTDPATFSADPSELEIPEPQLITQPALASSFGSQGSGDGQLQSPFDAAVDSQGNVWVLDYGNNRVEKFDSAGKLLAKVGSFGAGDGQFKGPTAIAVAPNGNVYVADSGNARIQRFDSAGAFLSKFGSLGSANGQFQFPRGIAIDATGNVWVSDYGHGRVQKFSPAGAFLQAFGTKGSGAGQLGEPAGLDVAPNGDVWISDWQNSRISVFSSAGTFISSFGSVGTSDGQFKGPAEIEIDKLGNVWIGDLGNNRVQQFDLSGQFKGKFGTSGQPAGIAADSKGHLWIADHTNNQVQRWVVPIERPAYMSAFGSLGSGDGQLQAPGDVAVGIDGSLWVADKSNNRIQHFDSTGKFLGKFGTPGAGDGQFNRPTAIAIDRDGDLLVTDSGNNRVQKFSPEGQFLSKFGSAGAGNGQFSSPEGIVADLEGNIWVADSGNGRIQKFSEEAEFLAVVGSKGSGSGQLGQPIGIDVDPSGNLWVGDLQNNRVSVFEPDGDYAAQFGSLGSGPGQFNRPSAIEVDSHGNVWVGDQSNQRVQRFDLEGNYVGQFGSIGSGEGQFSFPTADTPVGIATDSSGAIWVTDADNNRIQRWQIGNYQAEAPEPLKLNDGDAAVAVDTSGGLVTSVTGNAAGSHAYVHSGDDLTAHVGSDGETKYEYDGAGRMTKVTLPNGTWGSIVYWPDGRVRWVTVKHADWSASKTTEFEYQDEPSRRTTVFPQGAPHITYDIGKDGSVLKWWNAAEPPTIEPLMGNLFDNKQTPSPIPPGIYYLTARAWDAEGIASIDIIVNGNTVVDEVRCEQDLGKPGLECVEPPPVNEWVMETDNFSPGILWVEVLATDHTGESAAQRFWVNIPQQPPPPPPGAITPPKFNDIKKFREEYGLEVVFPVANEIELNERVFNLIAAWHNPNSPEGQFARASWERWGVPLRPADVAELEYRERYLRQDALLIAQWAASTAASTYAGFYMDHRAGGKIRVGFTADQAAKVAALEQQPGIDPDDRIEAFPFQPTRSLVQLQSISKNFDEGLGSRPDLMQLLTTGSLNIEANAVAVGATNVTPVQAYIAERFAGNQGISAYADSAKPTPRKTWLEEGVRAREINSRLYAGDWIHQGPEDGGCTLAFGAWEINGYKPNGAPTFANYGLTAGHCYAVGAVLKRGGYEVKDGKRVEALTGPIGKLERRAYTINSNGFTTDSEAIRLNSGIELPRWIYWSAGYQSKINGVAGWTPGMTICHSGTWGGTHCGATAPYLIKSYYEGAAGPIWLIRVFDYSIAGDSGSPVFDPITGSAIGLLSGGPFLTKGPTDIQPLLPLEGKPYAGEVMPGQAPGGLAASGMNSPNPLTIVDGG